MAKHEDWQLETAAEIIAAHRALDGAALPILHALQARFGFIHRDAIPAIAHALNLSRAEVHGIVSFYHDFRDEPPARHVLRLCRAEACQAMGGVSVADRALARVPGGWGGVTADGVATVEPVFCLGLCACAPAGMLDGEPVGRLTPARVDAMLDGLW